VKREQNQEKNASEVSNGSRAWKRIDIVSTISNNDRYILVSFERNPVILLVFGLLIYQQKQYLIKSPLKCLHCKKKMMV